MKLAGFFIGRQDYDSAVNNLEALTLRVKGLVRDSNKITTNTMAYTIPNSYILVGFSYDDKGTMKTDCSKENIVNSRARTCSAKSCLCIYQNYYGDDFDNKGQMAPVKCKPFDEKIVFLAPSDSYFMGSSTQWKPSHYQWPSYNYLVLYGECGALKTIFGGWGVRQVYIEKYVEGENNFIFIGDMSDSKILERSNYFKGKTS